MRNTCSRNTLVFSIVLALAGNLFVYGQDPDPAAEAISASSARRLPAWTRSELIYEVFPRSFSLKGNLDGVTDGLDRLKSLGVTVLWLMPIHPVGKARRLGPYGSPYAVQDYYAITPDYGTKDDLRRLINEAHTRGIKVILDVVADHTSYDSVMMSHPDFYEHDKNGQLVSPHGWSDVAALNYANPALRRYMVDMLLHWVKDFGVDGYRCDAAGMVPTDFWEQARAELDKVSPNLLMLSEASKPELERNAFSLDYAWPLLSTLDEVLIKGASASEVRRTIETQQKRFPKGAAHMLISDDHDTQRAVVRYGAPAALASSALMFTLDGVPLLYSGMEVGDATPTAGPALFESLKIYWPTSQIRPDFKKFYSFIIPFRAQHPALWQGELVWLHNSDEQHVVTFLRRVKDEEILVTINLSNTPFRGTVEAGNGAWREIEEPLSHPSQGALPAIALDAFQFRIFERAIAQ